MLFLAVFILVMSYILNSVVGVVCGRHLKQSWHKQFPRFKKRQLHALHELADILSQMYSSSNCCVNSAGFTLEALSSLLDIDGSGVLSRNEFMSGLFRLLLSNEFQRQHLARLGEANLRQTIMIVKDEIKQEIHLGNQRLVQEMQELIVPLG